MKRSFNEMAQPEHPPIKKIKLAENSTTPITDYLDMMDIISSYIPIVIKTTEQLRQFKENDISKYFNHILYDCKDPIRPGDVPNHITHLEFGHFFNHPIQPDIFSSNLHTLTFGYCFNQNFVLPDTIKSLTIKGRYDKKITTLPTKLQELIMNGQFNQPLVLPNGLKRFKCTWKFNHPIKLPASLIYLEVGKKFNQLLVLPIGLQTFKLHKNYKQEVNCPLGCVE